MTFAEKLDLLMQITKTSNILLARNIALDASFISRLRRGNRTPAKNVTYLQAMAEYFARKCGNDCQKVSLREAIVHSSQIQATETELSQPLEIIIYEWLNEKESSSTDSINSFLETVINFKFKKSEPSSVIENANIPIITSENEVFYGVKGKQTAAFTFLSLVLKSKCPQTLFLYSDEDMEWLTRDREFTAQWVSMLVQVLKKGNRIKMIHSTNRNFDEMMLGIQHWVPLYMTGAIEPYYYAKSKDGLFRQTFFVAPDTPAAVTSSSVESKTKNAANFLFTNHKTVQALSEEFLDFLHLCRPLMHISTPSNNSDNREYLSLLDEFEDEKNNTIIKADGLTSITMPPSVAISILTRIERSRREQLLALHQIRLGRFLEDIPKYRFTVICSLPNPEQILAGEVAVNFSDALSETQLFYTPDEYLQHLHGVIHLLETNENFSVYLTKDKHLEGVTIYVREDVGLFVVKTSAPLVVFAINESNITAAFWDYLQVLLNKESKSSQKRNFSLTKLKEVAHSLEGIQSTKNQCPIAD
ncbi:hypothetical protein DP73_20555 [Desulfosporosinus sp. HMP52]|uniref:hypothetical protein n=1 Tax=Desulfosporosinus sp. HMP52 TaxID=1487923 RepID=UPI00051FC5D1|nr:hypothetical protein [Desulfosporosinus sp. HMP52]KGK82454.1 hypothetical protein DP73_20555 [Desulfosporosinus sp. HMP52]